MALDTRIKELKCHACKLKCAPTPAAIDLVTHSCQRNRPGPVRDSDGACPFPQMIEFLENMEAKKQGTPKRLPQIPRLLEAKELPVPFTKGETTCYVCGEIVEQGKPHDCEPTKDMALAVSILSACKGRVEGGAGVVISRDDEAKLYAIEVDNPIHVVINKKGHRQVYEIR